MTELSIHAAQGAKRRMTTHWVIDWDKVQTVEHIKILLRSLDLRPRPLHPEFSNYQPLCKLIDDDGREVLDHEASQSKSN
jgi:hypothetical protein